MSSSIVDINSTHQYIILILSCLSFIAIAALLATSYIHRSRIPRHPVITVLLLTALPRILVLLIPFLIEGTLRSGVPYHEKDRTPEQQGTALAKFCVFQGLAATYLLGTHSAFIVSLTISVVHILRHPYTRPPSHRKKKQSSYLTLALCLGPFLYMLPVPILGLCIVLLTPAKNHIVFFQGTYCNVDVYAFAFTSSFMTGLPLVVALGILAWGVFSVVKFYLRTRVTSDHNDGSGEKKTQFLHLPPLSIVLRLGLLVFTVAVTSIMFLLISALEDQPLQTVLSIDRYWEAIVPLLEFLIFASQSAVLQVWFPKYFATDMGRLLQIQEKRHSKAAIGLFDLERAMREQGKGKQPRVSLRLSTSPTFSFEEEEEEDQLDTPGSGPSTKQSTSPLRRKNDRPEAEMASINESVEEESEESASSTTPQPPPAIPIFLRPMPTAHTSPTHLRRASLTIPTLFPER